MRNTRIIIIVGELPIGRSGITSPRRLVIVLSALVLAAAVPTLPPSPPAAAAPAEQPNLLFVMTDDQRIGTLDVMPEVRRHFNVRFSNAFVTTPLCCPSRATFLTGRYAHRHNVRTNGGYPTFKAREAKSLASWLKARGYHTGFIGKYFNHFRPSHGVPPGWDEFIALTTPEGDRYTRFSLREYRSVEGVVVQNEVVPYSQDTDPGVYSTTLFGERAEEFLTGAEALGKPWALFLWFNAPHTPLVPEEKYANAAVEPWKPPASFMERNMRDKPFQVRKFAVNDRSFHRRLRVGQLRLLMSVDEAVGKLFDRIEALGIRDDTWGVFTSDNGYLWGEHRLTDKDFAFEESVRVPFRMAVPDAHVGAAAARSSRGAFVANVDIAPTFMDLAGDRSSRRYDGRSLVPLVEGKKTRVRRAVVLENWRRGHYRGLRTARWKYVQWVGRDVRELYDLRRDPRELRNLLKGKKPAVRRAARRVVKKLHEQMRTIRARRPAPLAS